VDQPLNGATARQHGDSNKLATAEGLREMESTGQSIPIMAKLVQERLERGYQMPSPSTGGRLGVLRCSCQVRAVHRRHRRADILSWPNAACHLWRLWPYWPVGPVSGMDRSHQDVALVTPRLTICLHNKIQCRDGTEYTSVIDTYIRTPITQRPSHCVHQGSVKL
jgi:hypothetical protein